MLNTSHNNGSPKENQKNFLVMSIAAVLIASVVIGGAIGYFLSQGDRGGLIVSLVLLVAVPFASQLLYRKTIIPSYRRLEDSNLELHLKQEELLDTKDDLFIKFLGIYDVNYAANSPRLFANRLKDVADITARVMEADACLIYLFNKKKDDLELAATNDVHNEAVGQVRIPLGEGLEGWVGRRLEPLMLRDFMKDSRFKEIPGFSLSAYGSVYCLPLYVYSNGALVGVMELLFNRQKVFTDEEINFFTTLTGIISTTVQNEQMQSELRKMNMELEQWVTEKTEELRSSEERYRTLVENACESIFVLAENGDIVFANEQAARMTGFGKYDLIHKNLFELFVEPSGLQGIVTAIEQGKQIRRPGDLKKSDGMVVPVEVSAVGLTLMGKHFIQSVIHDMSSQTRLELLLEEKEKELSVLKAKFSA